MPHSLRPVLVLVAILQVTCGPAPTQDDEGIVAKVGPTLIEKHGNYTRIVQHETLTGMQITAPFLVAGDAPNLLGHGTQWESLALVGLHARWNPTHEPITYYHRTGPVGAVFHHLRTRAGGASATAPVGVVGLNCGTVAAYARRGQAVTFYESAPELKQLVAESDRHFTYLREARRRGATVEVRFGPIRKTLAADTDKRFALLLVEMIETGLDPGDRLTLEAVRLYLSRTRPDGLVALHVSNREHHLEPVVERISRDLKLVARVWHDDREGRPGKRASSWVVLARTAADLGPLAASPVEQVKAFGTLNGELVRLLHIYPPTKNAIEALLEQYGGPPRFWPGMTPSLLQYRSGPQAAILYQYAVRLRDAGEPNADLTRLVAVLHGDLFRPLAPDPAVELRTDTHRPPLPPLPPRK